MSNRSSPRTPVAVLAANGDPHGDQGQVVRVAGSVIGIRGLRRARLNDVVLIGDRRLPGEIIRLVGEVAVAQVYESANGLGAGDPVAATGRPLSVELGPGLLGSIVDGTARPLAALAGSDYARPFLARGVSLPTLDRDRSFEFRPAVEVGQQVAEGDVLGSVPETGGHDHLILVPPGISGTVTAVRPGPATVTDAVAEVDGAAVPMLRHWPVRQPRPVAGRLDATRPLVTGQRVIDTLFPVARGGTAAIPGGFGTGKTVLEQQVAKWADADLVVYVGCGERGNELAEVLEEFPRLPDPRTGGSLMDRTVMVANTSNMSVAAREASIYTGVTIAEYFRDQGCHVALLTDSTSRWGEALREISSRLEEMPAEEGYPAYLASRIAGFYERAGFVVAAGSDRRTGSVTIIGAVSPPSGDFSEPITQHTLRVAGTFWALDRDLARARHFPAVDWRRSYTLYQLAGWFRGDVAESWPRQRDWALDILQQETSLLEIVQLLGADTLPPQQQIVLRTGRLLREDFLQQSSFDETDAYCPLGKQHAMLSVIMAAHQAMTAAVTHGATAVAVTGAPVLGGLARMRAWPADEAGRRAQALAREVTEGLGALEGDDQWSPAGSLPSSTARSSPSQGRCSPPTR